VPGDAHDPIVSGGHAAYQRRLDRSVRRRGYQVASRM
jgi:hypothetical protein